jgi:hypothetical protein
MPRRPRTLALAAPLRLRRGDGPLLLRCLGPGLARLELRELRVEGDPAEGSAALSQLGRLCPALTHLDLAVSARAPAATPT